MQITIDCKEIHEKAQLHALIADKLHFPDWYGGNLDALFDALTDICEPLELTVTSFSDLTERLGSYADAFRRVVLRAGQESSNLTVAIHQ